MSLVTINDEYLTAIGDAIRAKNGLTNTYTPSEMASAIEAITTGSGAGELVITGDCYYALTNPYYVELVNNGLLTFDGVTKISNLAYNSTYSGELVDINFNSATSNVYVENVFYNSKFTKIGTLSGINYPALVSNVYSNAYYLKEVGYLDLKKKTVTTAKSLFNNCYSLRVIPSDFFTKLNCVSNPTSMFYNCFSLDKIENFRTNQDASGFDSYTFSNLYRLKSLIFKNNLNVSSYSNQTINLSQYVGYANSTNLTQFQNYTGFAADTRITDDATYTTLKDNDDYWTTNLYYSRYNHDSAVETINSLPDNTSGSGAVIKFKGDSGASTDGGAINTMTETEIAVATAKGWTVSYV